MKLFDRIRNGVNRVTENAQIFKKDIFELEGVPAFRQFYQLYVFVWQAIYKGYYAPWHSVKLSTIGHPIGGKRTLATMNAGQTVAAQMARYVWNERCKIVANQNEWNSTEPDPLNDYLQFVLNDNSFFDAFGALLEKTFALGGGAIKEWVEIPKDMEGNDLSAGRVRISYHSAAQFVPTAWRNNRVSEGIFINREAKDGYYYSVVEWHKRKGTTYRVTNELYREKINENAEPQNILGWRYPLNLIYPLLSPSTDFSTLEHTMFQYIRPFGANKVDDNSPLGMSIYSSALDTLHGLDEAFDSFTREFRLGKKRIIVPARAVRSFSVGTGGKTVRYFDSDDEVYEALAIDDAESLKIHDNSAELRIQPHIDGINGELAILCNQVGFDPGTLSFDKARGLKTAKEVVSENSKTYGTIQAHENGIRDSLTEMVHAIFELAARYGLEWEGVPVASLISRGYSVSVQFDDSIIQDADSKEDRGLKLIGAGVMSKKRFLIEIRGYTPEEAEAELEQIAQEQRITGGMVDDMMFSVSE